LLAQHADGQVTQVDGDILLAVAVVGPVGHLVPFAVGLGVLRVCFQSPSGTDSTASGSRSDLSALKAKPTSFACSHCIASC
jgi:hypothetical protein